MNSRIRVWGLKTWRPGNEVSVSEDIHRLTCMNHASTCCGWICNANLCSISGPQPQEMCAEIKPLIRRPTFLEFCRGVHESENKFKFLG